MDVGIGSTVIVSVGVGVGGVVGVGECVGRESVDGRPADGCGVGGGGVAVTGDCVGRELIGVGVGAVGTGVATTVVGVDGCGAGCCCGCGCGWLQEWSANESAAHAIIAYIAPPRICVKPRASLAIRFAFIQGIILN